jgi:hypothetical protein
VMYLSTFVFPSRDSRVSFHLSQGPGLAPPPPPLRELREEASFFSFFPVAPSCQISTLNSMYECGSFPRCVADSTLALQERPRPRRRGTPRRRAAPPLLLLLQRPAAKWPQAR